MRFFLKRYPSKIHVFAAAISLASCGSDYYDLTALEMERAQINAKQIMRPGETFASCMSFENSAKKDGLVMCFFDAPDGHKQVVTCSYHFEFCEPRSRF
jgi:hypothetical protein